MPLPEAFRRTNERGRRSAAGRSCAVGFAALAILSGCSNDDPAAERASTSTAAEAPAAGLESFCGEFADVLVQDDPDFGRLEASAPDEIRPEVDEVVEFSKMAATAKEAPDESVIDDFQRSLIGTIVYAVDNCEESEQLTADLGLGQQQVDAVRTYSLEDVRNDATWPEVQAAFNP